MPEVDQNGVAATAREIVDRIRTLARLEVELALLEIKRKLIRIVVGVGIGAGAALVFLFALGFLLAGAAAEVATALPVWAALLIVGGGLVLATGALIMLAAHFFRQGSPPTPDEAIEEARKTGQTLRGEDG